MADPYCADGIGLLLPISISRGYSNSKINSSLFEANGIDGWWKGGEWLGGEWWGVVEAKGTSMIVCPNQWQSYSTDNTDIIMIEIQIQTFTTFLLLELFLSSTCFANCSAFIRFHIYVTKHFER